MFRLVVANIRSLSLDTLKSTLYNCLLASLMRRSQHHGLFEPDISILGVSNDKDLMMTTTGRNM